jgi:hypothetical protein
LAWNEGVNLVVFVQDAKVVHWFETRPAGRTGGLGQPERVC